MKITMLKTAPGSEDGVTSSLYLAGEGYEVSEALAKTFIDSGLAAKAGGRKAKAEDAAPAPDAPAEPAADAPAEPEAEPAAEKPAEDGAA